MDQPNTSLLALFSRCEKKVKATFDEIDRVEEENSAKVLAAFERHHLSEVHFGTTTGYGYNDIGRDVIEEIFADVFGTEDALVRNQFISGTHALTVALFALLRPGDVLLSITGKPYDTLEEVIGIRENKSSLQSFGVHYDQIDLVDDDFDYDAIRSRLEASPVKVIEIQRSRGYALRKSLSVEKVRKVIAFIRKIDPEVILLVDNCYCEMVTTEEPKEADLLVGSLIKNLGAGIASNGAYVVGRRDLISLVAERLTVPGEGKEVGPSLGSNKATLLGLYFAPSAVAGSLKTAVLTSAVMEELGYEVDPKWSDERSDIVETITFRDPEKLIRYCQGIQMGSPVDSFAIPEPWDMPGYTDPVIMASGSFTQGSSIELSCDGPLRPPFVAFQQGGLRYAYGKLGVFKATQNLVVEGTE